MHSENIIVSKTKLADLKELLIVAKNTFSDAFAKENTKENMEIYLSENFTFEKLLSEFNNTDSKFYIATLNKKIVGYMKINFEQAQTTINDNQSIEIERIYVVKEFQGQRIGELLCSKAFEIAKKKSQYVWLGVWEKNRRAISFYKKNGFIEFDKHNFKLGNEEQTDILMRKQDL